MVKQDKNKLVGQIFLEGKELTQATEIEIQPGGNAEYAITIRLDLDTELSFNYRDITPRPQDLVYKNLLLGEERAFSASLLGSGIVDQLGKTTLILFFKGRGKIQERPRIIT